MSFYEGKRECQVEWSLRCHNFWVIVGGDAEKGFLICIIIVVSALPHILSPKREMDELLLTPKNKHLQVRSVMVCCLTFGLSPDFTTSDGNLKKVGHVHTSRERHLEKCSLNSQWKEVCKWCAIFVFNPIRQSSFSNKSLSLDFPPQPFQVLISLETGLGSEHWLRDPPFRSNFVVPFHLKRNHALKRFNKTTSNEMENIWTLDINVLSTPGNDQRMVAMKKKNTFQKKN